jgi:hypothetical protein
MLDTAVITETEIDRPATLAFRIDGRVTQTEMKMMSDRVLEAFDAHDKIDLLLVFDRYAGSEPGASLSAPTLKAQTASLWNIRAYVVAGAPDEAEQMIETMGRVIPVKAKTFATEAEARDYLASLPPLH